MKNIYIVFLCFIIIPVCSLFADGAETAEYIPETCTAVVTLTNMQKDSGLSWLYDAWINSPRESVLKDFIKTVGIKSLSVATLPPKGGYPIYVVIVFQLPKDQEINPGLINNVILRNTGDSGALVKTLEHKGKTITYIQEKPVKDEFSAYCVLNDILILATDTDIIKKAIDGPGITGNEHYKNLPESGDCFYFAENSDARFANFLKPLEKKWKISLLLSVDDLSWMGSSFDIIDENKASGEIIFTGSDASQMEDMIDDAEFLGEAFKRKFTAEKISYSGEVTVKGTEVKLTFQLDGLKPLWAKLFEGGVMNALM